MPESVQNAADDIAFGFFTRGEGRTIAAAMARIFPDDDLGPGARQAGAVYYLDRALAGAEHRMQQFYRSAIRRLDTIARQRFGNPFAVCSHTDQDALIGEMANDTLPGFGEAPTSLAFFEALRAHTIEGIFSDPVHGGNRDFAGWRLLGYPGPQPSYSHAEQQLDAVILRDRFFTAADYPLAAQEN